MSSIGRFLMEKSIFAVVPVLCLILLNFQPVDAPVRKADDPWSRHRPSGMERLHDMLDRTGEWLGMGRAHASSDAEAAMAFRRARIAAVYAGAHYSKRLAAARLGMSTKRFEATLRQYGIVEWPEGHKGL